MINQDTACMFASCYDNKEGHLPADMSNVIEGAIDIDFLETLILN